MGETQFYDVKNDKNDEILEVLEDGS